MLQIPRGSIALKQGVMALLIWFSNFDEPLPIQGTEQFSGPGGFSDENLASLFRLSFVGIITYSYCFTIARISNSEMVRQY